MLDLFWVIFKFLEAYVLVSTYNTGLESKHTFREVFSFYRHLCKINTTLRWPMCVTISPFWPCFWPSSFSFSQQVHALFKSLCKKTTKTSYNTRYPLGTNYYKEMGISNYSAGVSLRLIPRFAHISSSNPSTAKSSLDGPASGSSR